MRCGMGVRFALRPAIPPLPSASPPRGRQGIGYVDSTYRQNFNSASCSHRRYCFPGPPLGDAKRGKRGAPFLFRLVPGQSMMKQPQTRKRHGHAKPIGSLDHIVIADGPARLRDELHAGARRAHEAVAEWEECIAAQRYPAERV